MSADWIETYLQHSEGIPSPRIWRLWSAISCVGAALERRVWIVSAGDKLYPTLYILLVGKPGSGKSQAIRPISALWYGTKELHVASNSVTKASLTDELDAAKRILLINGEPIEYHSLQIAASEFGVLVPSHDLDFLNFLNNIYDNDPNYRESRRTSNRKIDTINPQINILAGTQPAYLASLLPEEAWGMGFMTRMIMVYSGEVRRVQLFNGSATQDLPTHKELLARLKDLCNVYGECIVDDAAKYAIQEWNDADCPPVPQHSRLANYVSRRILHVLRLCMVSAASAGHPLRMKLEDFQRARDWLVEAEQTMPDIFKEMVQKSDTQILQELHLFAWNIWIKNKDPIHEARLIYFLQSKVPTDKIERLLQIAVRANMFDRDAMQPLYRPRPINEHGIE